MKVLYVADDNVLDQLLTSIISLNKTNPNIEAYVYFTQKGRDMHRFANYKQIPYSIVLDVLESSFPKRDHEYRNQLTPHLPQASLMKIPVLHYLSFDKILYVDVDTLFVGPIDEIFSLAGGLMVSPEKFQGEDACDFNAGVMLFSKSYLTDALFEEYVERVRKANGQMGDQEILTAMKLKFGYLPKGYNTRAMGEKTRILHFAGKKPFNKKQHELNVADKMYVKAYSEGVSILKYCKD